jgi:hypothetical protein
MQGRKLVRASLLALVAGCTWAGAFAQESTVYRCPGKANADGRRSDEYTNLPSAKQAKEMGCRTLEGAPITVIQSSTPRKSSDAKAAESAARASDSKVSPAEQKARDSDAKRIWEEELRKAEEALAQLKKDYNNGEPERRGDEKNYQKYQDRVAEMKTAITRKEAEIEALKREMGRVQ